MADLVDTILMKWREANLIPKGKAATPRLGRNADLPDSPTDPARTHSATPQNARFEVQERKVTDK